MQEQYKLLLTLNLIVVLSHSQKGSNVSKSHKNLAHSSLCFKGNLQARFQAELPDYLDICFTVLDLVLGWTYWNAGKCYKKDEGGLPGQSLFMRFLVDGVH